MFVGGAQNIADDLPLISAVQNRKLRLVARCLASSRKMRMPSEWKVLTVSPRKRSGGSRLPTRSCISRAALLVKVMAAILRASICAAWIR